MDELSIRFWITVSLAGLVFHGLAECLDLPPARAVHQLVIALFAFIESSLMPHAMLAFVPLTLIGYRYAVPLHARLQPFAGEATRKGVVAD